MAKTIKDLVTGAYRTARIIAIKGETLDGDREQYGIDKLNEMLHAWDAEGIYIAHVDVTKTDTFPYPDSHFQKIRDCLAVKLADDQGSEISDQVRRDAASGKSDILDYYAEAGTLSVDRALHPYYNQNRPF